jgi:hypothetical protein
MAQANSGQKKPVSDMANYQALPPALRPRFIARRDPSFDQEGLPPCRIEVILRGDGETPFFLD